MTADPTTVREIEVLLRTTFICLLFSCALILGAVPFKLLDQLLFGAVIVGGRASAPLSLLLLFLVLTPFGAASVILVL